MTMRAPDQRQVQTINLSAPSSWLSRWLRFDWLISNSFQVGNSALAFALRLSCCERRQMLAPPSWPLKGGSLALAPALARSSSRRRPVSSRRFVRAGCQLSGRPAQFDSTTAIPNAAALA